MQKLPLISGWVGKLVGQYGHGALAIRKVWGSDRLRLHKIVRHHLSDISDNRLLVLQHAGHRDI